MDLIDRQAAIDALDEQIRQCDKVLSAFNISMKDAYAVKVERASLVAFRETLEYMPSAQPEITRCKDCKYWRRQTNYAGAPLSFGFCESDDMWRSLYGETYEVSHIDTDDDFYCGYAERREE